MTSVVNAINDILGSVSVTWTQLFTDVMAAFQGFGGLAWSMKIAVIVMIVIGLMKISSLSGLWAKLGSAQAWLAPGLGLLLGVLTLGASGTLSWSGIFAYMGSGAGAIALHELLDAVKAIPGLGTAYVSIINFIEGVLPGPLSKKRLAAPKA
jgi:hypothetical protein